jgi:hypothetical protein
MKATISVLIIFGLYVFYAFICALFQGQLGWAAIHFFVGFGAVAYIWIQVYGIKSLCEEIQRCIWRYRYGEGWAHNGLGWVRLSTEAEEKLEARKANRHNARQYASAEGEAIRTYIEMASENPFLPSELRARGVGGYAGLGGYPYGRDRYNY